MGNHGYPPERRYGEEDPGALNPEYGAQQPSSGEQKALADAEVRSRVLDPRASFHLEAPAGSGKTFLLTARFLNLLGMVDHPQQILALTFTNKAAGEMNERVGRYLARAQKGHAPSDGLDAQLLDAAAKALRRHKACRELLLGGELLRIQTFHSFCYSIVSQAPLEAGIVPGSTLLVEPDQIFFLREVIDQTLLEVMSRGPDDSCRKALENRLLYLNNSWPQLARELEELMQRREALWELLSVLQREGCADFILHSIRELVEVELKSLKKAFAPCPLGTSWSGFLQDLAKKGAGAASLLPPGIPQARWESLPAWDAMATTFLTQKGEPRKKFGPATGFYSGFVKTEWAALIQTLNPSAVERLNRIRQLPAMEAALPDLDTLVDLSLLLLTVLQNYQDRCRRQRMLDFTGLEEAALRLFHSTEPSDLQLMLDQQIRHVLIDEFQDTNYQQWKLLQGMCAEWSDGDGRTLFLVGDPKQSIYSFRKADVQLFMKAANGLPLDEFRVLDLKACALNTNFRSHPHLIEWCNDLFERTIMRDAKRDLDEVDFAPSVASPKTKAPEKPLPPELAMFLACPDPQGARQREAKWLAHRVAEEVKAAGDSGAQIGILLFTRTHLPFYLEALQRQGVAVRVAEGLKLPERPEVRYLYQLCRALVFPHDHLAWASQLHSPWLLLDFSQILAISREEPEPWVEKIRSYAGQDERVAAFWENLRTARQHLGHEPLADVLEEAWLNLGGAHIVTARWGSRGLACCRQFLELIRQAEVHEPVQTLMRLEQLLEHAFEPIDPDTASSPVSMMTVHKAKGLEFDTVFLPFLDWCPIKSQRSAQPPYLLERVPGSSDRYLLAAHPDRRRGEPDPIYQWLHRLQIDRRWGEAKRLFYVAATRAKSKLLLSGVLPWQGKNGGPSFPSQTPLSWLNGHYELADRLGLSDLKQPQAPVSGENESTAMPEWEKVWQNDSGEFQVLVEPPIPEPVSASASDLPPITAVRPAPFERESPLLKIRNPSAFVQDADDSELEPAQAHPGSPEVGRFAVDSDAPADAPADFHGDARLLGTLIHRLLEEYGRTARLPSVEQVCGFVRQQGVEEPHILAVAQSALGEVEACLQDPWLQKFYALPGDRRFSEWSLEALHDSRTLYVGQVDLIGLHEGKWWLIDFKTSGPSGAESPELFCRKALEKYRPQLLAYREMWAKTKGLAQDDIEAVIYWTPLRCWGRV